MSNKDELQTFKDNALENYMKAQEIARNFTSTHPIRLGLDLNFSVFY